MYSTVLHYKQRETPGETDEQIYRLQGVMRGKYISFSSIHHAFLFLHSSIIVSHPSSISSLSPIGHFIPVNPSCEPVWAGLTYGWSQLYSTAQTPASWGPAEPPHSLSPWGFDVNGHTGNSWWTTSPMNGQRFVVMGLSTPCTENRACNTQLCRMVQAWGGAVC